MTPSSRKILKQAFPEMASQINQEETNEILQKVFNGISMVKGEKGDKGDPGFTPVRGKDYMTKEDIAYLLYNATPTKGKDYFTPKEIDSFLESVRPVKGVHYFDGKEGARGEKGTPGKGGKDGSPDEPKDIVSKLRSLKGEERLNIKDIHGSVSGDDFQTITKKLEDGMIRQDGRIKLIDQRWGGHGGIKTVSTDSTLTGDGTISSPLHANQKILAGTNVTVTGTGSISDPYIISSSGSGAPAAWMPPETPVGAIDGVNDTYTISYVPAQYSGIITINGKIYDELTDWTIVGNTITFINILDASLATSTFKFKGQLDSPVITGYMELEDGSSFLLEDGTDLLLE